MPVRTMQLLLHDLYNHLNNGNQKSHLTSHAKKAQYIKFNGLIWTSLIWKIFSDVIFQYYILICDDQILHSADTAFKNQSLSITDLLKVKDQSCRVFKVWLPEVWKPRHRCAIDDAVVGRPADIHDMGSNDVTIMVEPWKLLRILTSWNSVSASVKLDNGIEAFMTPQ